MTSCLVDAELACTDIVLAASRLCSALETDTADACAHELHELQLAVAQLHQEVAENRPRVIQALARRMHGGAHPTPRMPLRPRTPQPDIFAPETPCH